MGKGRQWRETPETAEWQSWLQQWKTTAADNDGDGGRRWWWTTMAADDDGSQDWAADYDREGQERAVRDGGDSGVAMRKGHFVLTL